MKMQWIVLGALATSSFAFAQAKQVGLPQVRSSANELSPYHATKGAVSTLPQASSTQGLALASTGADDCSMADAIAGPGTFPFDNSTGVATTGTNGQNNSPACTSSGLTAIENDVWFAWTAPTTGLVVLSDCGQTTVDTKIAVYDFAAIGGVCPAPLTASTVVGCNDDFSAALFQSRVAWNAAAGSVYLIQLGTFPGAAGGTGSFSIEYYPPADATPCQTDSGDSDVRTRVALAGNGNTEHLVLQPFGKPGDLTQVDNILVSYGALFGAANTALVDGMAVNVLIYDDPTDDWDPTDAVLVQNVSTTVAQHDTDLFNTVPLAPSAVVNGVYFVGWAIKYPATVPANWFPFAADLENCESLFDGWAAWNLANNMNFSDLSATGGNSQVVGVYAPTLNGVVTTNIAWMVRPDCHPLTAGAAFCFGDGTFTDHTTACPCGNFGVAGNGCGHSFSAAGANMTASGSTALDNVVLHSSNEPVSSFTLMMQHGNTGDGVFHDGVLCASNPLIRLRGRAAVAGEAFFPNSNFAQDSTTTLSQRGGVTVGSGAVRFYAGWYRNASTTFCPPATANVTNGWQITW